MRYINLDGYSYQQGIPVTDILTSMPAMTPTSTASALEDTRMSWLPNSHLAMKQCIW